MNLLALETEFLSFFDVEELKREAKDSFQKLIENPENFEIRNDIYNLIGDESYEPYYLGTSIHILYNNIKTFF